MLTSTWLVRCTARKAANTEALSVEAAAAAAASTTLVFVRI